MTTYEFRTEPMAHQRRALHKVIDTGGRTMLAVEAGLGKTKVVLDYASMIATKKGTCTMFVTAPLSAVDTWEDEAAKHVPEEIHTVVHVINSGTGVEKAERIKTFTPPPDDLDFPVLVIVAVNLDLFSQSSLVPGTSTVTVRDRAIAAVRGREWDLGVVDESHRIKGRNSNVSRALGLVAQSFPRRLALTGTVQPHSPIDWWGQMRWVNDDVLDRWGDFKALYVHEGGWMGKEVVGFRNLKHLSQRLAPWVFTAEAEHCLDLPEYTEPSIRVELTPKERKTYEQVQTEALAEVTESDGTISRVLTPHAISRWMKLRQVTSGFLRDAPAEYDLGTSKQDAAVDKVYDLTQADEKVVVFAHFVRDVTSTAERLSKRLDCPVEHIYGDTPADERKRIRKMFLNHDGPMVVVAQMRTVGIAINEFVAARHAIFLSYSERYEDYVQAYRRLYRKGQERAVTLWHVVAKDTLDEAILESYRHKGSLEDAVLSEARRLSRSKT